jgi:hypothetical protein
LDRRIEAHPRREQGFSVFPSNTVETVRQIKFQTGGELADLLIFRSSIVLPFEGKIRRTELYRQRCGKPPVATA